MLHLLTLAAETESIDGWLKFLSVTGTPGTLVGLYIVWWKMAGKEKADREREAQQAQVKILERMETSSERSERNLDRGESLLSRGDRVVERIEAKFPSGTWGPPKGEPAHG